MFDGDLHDFQKFAMIESDASFRNETAIISAFA